MAKVRIPIPSNVAADIMYLSDRTCCVCNEPGKAIQIHHVNEDPSDNKPENLIVLCLECHHQTQLSGGFGRHLNGAIVLKYKSEWEKEIAARRTEARELALNKVIPSKKEDLIPEILASQIEQLPGIKAHTCKEIGETSGRHSTNSQAQSYYRLSDLYKTILASMLSPWDLSEAFKDIDAEEYYSDLASKLYEVKRAVIMPLGTHGSMWRPIIAASVANELNKMVVNTVSYLAFAHHVPFDFPAWEKRWNDAGGVLKA